MKLSKRIQRVEPSVTLSVTAKAKSLKAAGKDVISLSAGEPDFDTPAPIKEAAKKALDAGDTKYTPVMGNPRLREEVARWLCAQYGLDASFYNAENVAVGNGGKQVLFNAFCTLLDPGDEVLILAPYWVSYPDMASFCGARTHIIKAPIEASHLPSLDAIQQGLALNPALLVLNSPSNPSGVVYPKSWLEALAEMLRQPENAKVFVITDDIYRMLSYGDKPALSLIEVAPDLADRIFIVQGLSKSHAMTGWRMGFGIGPKAMIQAMSRLQGASTSGVCSIAQAAAIQAVQMGDAEIISMRDQFKKRRDHILQRLLDIDGIRCIKPEGAFYVFPNVSSFFCERAKDSIAMANFLLDEVGLATVPGKAFGAPGHLRLSYAYGLDQIDAGIDRLESGIKKLRN